MVLWATSCAKHVLRYFEEQHPKEQPPITMPIMRRLADATRAAGHAAATSHVAGHASHAATYAAKAAAYAGADSAKERNWQLKRLLDLGKRRKEGPWLKKQLLSLEEALE